ncbi:MAG: hypothetical protein ACOCRX_04760 [Candidatus Woesearchaeota archaeon]
MGTETIGRFNDRNKENERFKRNNFHAEKQNPIIKELDFENEMIVNYIIEPLKDESFSLHYELSKFDNFSFFLSKKDKERKRNIEKKMSKLKVEIEIWRNCIQKNEEEIKKRLIMIYYNE